MANNEITIECLRSESGYSLDQKESFMWTLVGDDEQFIFEIEPRTHYECELCEKSPRSQYSLVQHVQSQYHRSEAAHKRQLTDDALQAVAKIEGEGFGKNFVVEGGAGEDLGFMCRICSYGGHLLNNKRAVIAHVKSRGHRDELAVKRSMFPLMTTSSLSLQDKVRAMWKLIQEFEGENFARSHIERTSPYNFQCILCDVHVSSPFNVAQHARGMNHQKNLEDRYNFFSSDEEETFDEDYSYDEDGYYYY